MRNTVSKLVAQVQKLSVPAEIMCVDDCSDAGYRQMNYSIADWVNYSVLDHNIGRSRIRNLLLQKAQYDYLLFLDCDSLIPDGFLQRYVDVLGQEPQVVCGGRVYRPESDDRNHHLRYRYGIECECKNAKERKVYPYRSFMTNNFLVRREVLTKYPFDERISRYGHEDTLWGYRLMQAQIPILHIENPVVNGDVETNEIFLSKTQDGVKSLAQIYRFMQHDTLFCQQVSLLDFYCKVKSCGAVRLIYTFWRLSSSGLRKAFSLGHCSSMRLFSFYKLGLFIKELGDK